MEIINIKIYNGSEWVSYSVDAKNITFSKPIYTAYSIGSISASANNRKVLFNEGDNLYDRLDAIFDVTLQPSKSSPNLTLTIDPTSVTGEVGSDWPAIETSTSTTAGSYTYGPATGVTWIGSAAITQSGNANGKFGGGNRTYTASQSYNAATANAVDNKGNPSSPAVTIAAGSDSASQTVKETVQYRYFYGNVSGDTVTDILNNLKNIKTSTSSLVTALSKQSKVNITLTNNGYIYFISKDTINGASMGGFEFPITLIGTQNFTNSYGASYSVKVYRSSLEQTPETYEIVLS